MKTTATEIAKIETLKGNKSNPRLIKDHRFKQLVKSIKEAPWMLQLRPIVVNNELTVLGGNMRLEACKAAGLKQVPIVKADSLTEEQQREFIIKDNISLGEWDWDLLANEWPEPIGEWGIEVWKTSTAFEPKLNPLTGTGDVTDKQIEKTGAALAGAYNVDHKNIFDVICPKCGNEFKITG